jgi:hypothetical protein
LIPTPKRIPEAKTAFSRALLYHFPGAEKVLHLLHAVQMRRDALYASIRERPPVLSAALNVEV